MSALEFNKQLRQRVRNQLKEPDRICDIICHSDYCNFFYGTISTVIIWCLIYIVPFTSAFSVMNKFDKSISTQHKDNKCYIYQDSSNYSEYDASSCDAVLDFYVTMLSFSISGLLK